MLQLAILNCDASVTATCNPPSCSTFPSGRTTVNCSATDQAGNPADCSFHVTVTCGGGSRPMVKITAPDNRASEPGSNTGQFRVTRTGPTGAKLKVFYQVSGTANPDSDYETLLGFITIKAGKGSATFKVKPKNDSRRERTETVQVTLSPNNAYDIASPNNATVYILDND